MTPAHPDAHVIHTNFDLRPDSLVHLFSQR